MTDEGKSANTGDQNDKNEPEDLVVLTTQEQDESLTEQDESPAEESAVVDGVLEGVAGDVEDSSTIDSRDTEVLMDLFVSQYGVLPDDHPLVERCRGFFDRLCDDDSIEFGIFEGDMGIQAVAAANRTVYLTKGAIDFCQTEEELLFLLMHEIKHIESGHFDEVPDGKSRTFISSLGMGRRKELVDADMRALRALDKKGVNIDGAFSFLSRLGESDIGDAYDTAHGSLKDRLLLLKSSLNFADFAHYKPEQQTPLSDEVKQAEHLTEMRGFPIVQREIPGMEERAVLRAETIESLTLRELVVNYFDLKREVNERQAKLRNRRKKKFVMKDQYKRYVEISRPLLSRMEELIYEKMEVDFGFSNEVVDLFLDLGKKILIDAVWKWSAEGDGKFNQSFYSRLGDSDFTDRLLTLKGRADLDKWALNFRSRLSESAIKQLTQKAGAVDRIADECSNDESDKKFVKNLLLVMIQGYSEDGSIEDASYLDVEEGESGADLVDGRGESWFGHTDKEYTMMADLELGLDKYDTSQVMNNLVDDWDFGFVSKSERLWEVQAAITFMFGAIRRHFRDNDVKLSDEGNGYLKKMHGLFSSVFNEGFESIEVVKLDVLLQEMTRSDIPEFEKKMFMLMLNKLINSSTRVVNYQGIEGSEVSGYFQRISKMCHGLFDRDPKFATSGVTEVWFSDYARFFRSRSTSFSINVLEEVQQSGDLDDKDMDALLERFIITVGDRKISMEDYKSLHEHFWDAKYQRFCSRYRNILVANVNRDKVQVEEGHFEFVLEVCVENNVLRPSNLDLAGYGEGDLFYKLIKAKEWDQSGIDENFMILRISNLSRDPVKKERIEIKAWGRILDIWESEGRSVGDLLDVVPKWVVIPVDVMEKISEDMAESAPDIVKCKDYLADRLRDDERIGKFVAGEWLARQLHGKVDKMEFMMAILDPDSDVELRDIILKACYGSSEGFRVALGSKDSIDEWVNRQARWGLDLSPARVLDSMYLMNDFHRRALVHYLLTGKDGILFDGDKVMKLVDFLFEKYLREGDDSDRTLLEEMKKILAIAIQESDPEDIYFVMSELLSTRVFQAGGTGSWDETSLYSGVEENVFHDMNYDRKRTQRTLEDFVYGTEENRRDQSELDAADALIGDWEDRPKVMKKDVVEFIMELAGAMSSIGTRFLQLMGMYMDVPEKYKRSFEGVFGDVKGQHKITAFTTVQDNVPEGQLGDLRMGSRLGGGAMMTVYPFRSEQMEGVVKVINPNVTAKTDIIYRTLKKTFERLVEEEGDKYRPLLYILEDIRAWIMADVDLPASAALDEDFRAANVGQTSASGRFESKVPDVYLSNSKFVIEQFVDGKTLQRMKVASEGEVGEVTDFIRLRFLEQIMEGVVHSNIHPDNFKVTEDGHLYWLDRTLLLKLSEEEQGLLISSGLQESNEDRMRTFVAGLLGLEDNKGVGEEVGQQLLDDIEPLLSENMEEMIKNVFILLRQRDVQIPLNITLVFNNILAILKMDQYIGKSSTA